ncbi:hypothetical protein FRC01_001669 [Tulasnella sp. 417]|nr:hypothetical protein FRC01_001669 [Tulasnella sp. 417]
MPPTTPTTGSSPASLNYLVIYNPTLQPDPTAPKQPDVDEDDEIEQAHILFYTARDRAVSRDAMLRQVGLAKALNNFSEMFALHGCDSVHSQKRRTVVFSPETDFWMVASVDVPKNPRAPASTSSASKDKSKRPPNKSNDKSTSATPATTTESFEYRENVLFDDVLRTYLRRGYEEFKRHFDVSSRAALEKSLEQFFTPWAWKWDVDVISEQSTSSSSDTLDDNGPDFSSYLGIPLHSTTASQTKTPNLVLPILDRIYESAPPATSPALFCLQPPSIFLPPAVEGAPTIPPSLPRYLLSTIQLPPELRRRPRRASVASTATLRSPPRNHKQAASIAGSTAASFIPRINQGFETVAGVANPKKWGWPGFLTFGKSEGSSVAPSRDATPPRTPKDSVSTAATGSPNPEKEDGQDGAAVDIASSGNGTEVPSRGETRESDEPIDARPEQDHRDRKPEETSDIDQSLLLDAIKDVADAMRTVASSEPAITDHDRPTSEAQSPPAPEIPGETPPTEVPSGVTTPPTETDKPIPTTGVTITASPEDAPGGVTTPPSETDKDSPTAGVTVTSPPEDIPSFINMTIHIDSRESEAGNKAPSLTTAKLSYLTRGRLVFALVHNLETQVGSEPSEWQTELLGSICKQLEELDQAIEKENLRSEDKLVGRAQSVDTTMPERTSNTRHVIYDPNTEVASSSLAYNSRSPHYSTAKQLFISYPAVSEVFARANSSKWFAAKRKTGDAEEENNQNERVYYKEAYAEVGRKDASLVDVDQERKVSQTIMSSGPEILALPQVTVQHDIGTVMDEVKQGTVLAEDAWVSCYLQGATSVHGKANVSLSNESSSKFILEGTDGISTTWVDRYSFQVSCPSLEIKDAKVRLPKTTFGELKAQYIPKAIQAFDVSPNGALFVTGIDNGSISVQSASSSSSSAPPKTGKPHVSSITTLRFFPSNEVILAGSLDMSVSVISAVDLSVPRKLKGHSRGVTDTAIVDRGRNVVSCAKDGTVRLWDVGGNKQIRMMGVESWSPILKMAYGATPQALNLPTNGTTETALAEGEVGTQDKLLCCALQSGRFTLLDLGSKSPIYTSPASSSPALHSIALSDNYLATGASNGLISLYDIRNLGSGTTDCEGLLFRCKRNDATIEDLSFVGNSQASTGIPDIVVATVDGLPFRLGYDGEKPYVVEELAGNDCDPVRVVRVLGEKVWTAGDDGLSLTTKEPHPIRR